MKIKKICLVCNKNFLEFPSRIKDGKGKFCSKICCDKEKIGKRTGKENYNWKGDNVGKPVLHRWIYRWFGFPNKCEHCGFMSNNHRKIHWSNKSGEYKRDISDWQRLCVPCHTKYDIKNGKPRIYKRFPYSNSGFKPGYTPWNKGMKTN